VIAAACRSSWLSKLLKLLLCLGGVQGRTLLPCGRNAQSPPRSARGTAASSDDRAWGRTRQDPRIPVLWPGELESVVVDPPLDPVVGDGAHCDPPKTRASAEEDGELLAAALLLLLAASITYRRAAPSLPLPERASARGQHSSSTPSVPPPATKASRLSRATTELRRTNEGSRRRLLRRRPTVDVGHGTRTGCERRRQGRDSLSH
jgi:hypothetical protein